MSTNRRALSRLGASVSVAAALAGAGAAPVIHAATWHTVLDGRTEKVAIDKSRIARGFSGTTAWSRIDLGRAVDDPNGRYDAIEAQNLYDCDGGKFTTLRRAYFSGTTLVRQEKVVRQRANRIQVGSIDERLWSEACLATDVAAAKGGAETVPVTPEEQAPDGERPSAMHADMRSLAGENGGRILPVADAHGGPAEKPKMIQLPPIDKAAAEAAAAGVAARQGGTPPAPSAPPVAGAKPAPQVLNPPAAKTAEPKPVPRAVEMAAANENRRTRELILATSGPKRGVSAAAAKAPPKKDESHDNPAQHMHAHWGYDGAGAPANWGKMKPEYATCDTGKRQSPIDIREGIKVDLEGVKFDYKPTKFRIVDNGHTVQVNVGAGSTINVMGKRYELVQFHFHKPSEERINGRPFDMVIHFVHKDYDDNLAVIALLLETGGENPQIQTLWNNMPLEPNQELAPADVLDTIKLFPENRAYWTYMGSLTTPPCTENVLWMVMKQPQQMSPEQIAIFGRLYKNNARPVQPANGRLVKESR